MLEFDYDSHIVRKNPFDPRSINTIKPSSALGSIVEWLIFVADSNTYKPLRDGVNCEK